MRVVFIIMLWLLCLSVISCSAVDAYRGNVAERGADASDQALESAEWALCSGVSVGAVVRRYNTQDKRSAYNALCDNEALP